MVLAQPQLIYRICRALRGEVLHGLVGVRVKDQTEVFEPHQCGVDLKRYPDHGMTRECAVKIVQLFSTCSPDGEGDT